MAWPLVGRSLSRTTIKSGLTPQIIRHVIRQHLQAIKYCYHQELAKDPKLRGKVVVQFLIAADGKVPWAKVSRSTLGNRAVEHCIVKVVRRMRFPKNKSEKGTTVSYPFVFVPKGP
jgi:TonB family protein